MLLIVRVDKEPVTFPLTNGLKLLNAALYPQWYYPLVPNIRVKCGV
jgi:hypothetical protein